MGGQQAALIPAGITTSAEKVGAHIVVHAMHLPTQCAQKWATTSEPIRPDEPVTNNLFMERINRCLQSNREVSVFNQ